MSLTKTSGTQFKLPPIIFGTSRLGNLYQSVPYETKLAIVKA